MKARRILYLGSAVLVGLGFGVGSAWWSVGSGMSYAIQCGSWRHYPYYGSPSANPYVRARTQLAGPLALDRSEAIYFIADRDDQGQPLHPGRAYRIEGHDFDARWWSITAYGEDHHLIPNPQSRYSYNSENVARNEDGSYTILLSNTASGGNRIPTGRGKKFELFLRLYNPAPGVLEDVRVVELPRIVREDSADE
ncbi:DUF1214 domain-containing protein [Crocinitomicaceae bacterium]|nr:DUF1214 domain-containing protein [Crocinitomicaceae bacterium]